MKRAQYFITCNELTPYTVNEVQPEYIRKVLTEKQHAKKEPDKRQLTILFPD
jgi:predicted DNA-binding helix-hairpin-helix protein